MNKINKLCLLFALLSTIHVQAKSIYAESITGLLTPESVVQADNGDIFVSEINEFNKDGDGQIKHISPAGKVSTYARDMDDPKGLTMIGNKLYVADKNRILEVTSKNNWRVYVPETAFPFTPEFLNDIVADQYGNLYVSDSGDLKSGGAIYKIDQDGVVSVIVDLYRVNIGTGKMTKLAEGFGGGDGIIKTKKGKIYVSDWKNGYIFHASAGKARIIKGGYNSPADIALSIDGEQLLIPVMKAGTLDFMKLK